MSTLELVAPNALGIGAASFWSAAEKDIAESPTAERSGAGTPKKDNDIKYYKKLNKQTG
jgi:hypothetical protein